jgi:acetolactate synthase-1/2/3 large subunit
MSLSGGEILLDLLKSQGVEYIFCSPGTEWTPVWEGLVRRWSQGDDSLKYINCRHEILAISMAMGYAETTGRLPAVLLHASVGALNGALAIRNARLAGVPMLIFSGETRKHRTDDEVSAQGWHWLGLLSDRGGPPSLVKDYVKWSNSIDSRDSLFDSVYRGCQIARTAPHGPVFLSIATDILIRSLEGPANYRSCPVPVVTEPRVSDLEKAARLLIDSRQPVIFTEHTGKTRETVSKLTELAELLNIPVFESSLPYYANFPKNSPMYMGSNFTEMLKKADTVFVVEAITPWYPPSAIEESNATVIQMSETPWHENLPYWGYHADLSIVTNIEQGLTALLNIIRTQCKGKPTRPDKKRLEALRANHDDILRQWETEVTTEKDNKPISAKWFLYQADKILPDNAVILDETLTHTRYVHRYLGRPGGYLKSAYGSLGVGLGESAGVKLASPDRPVIHVVGDGAFNYNPVLAGLGLCQEYDIPLIIMIMDNGGYMAMKLGFDIRYPQGWAVSQNTFPGVDITPPPDYIKIAEAFGARGEKLTDPDEIAPTLNRALEHLAKGTTTLLDVILAPLPPP